MRQNPPLTLPIEPATILANEHRGSSTQPLHVAAVLWPRRVRQFLPLFLLLITCPNALASGKMEGDSSGFRGRADRGPSSRVGIDVSWVTPECLGEIEGARWINVETDKGVYSLHSGEYSLDAKGAMLWTHENVPGRVKMLRFREDQGSTGAVLGAFVGAAGVSAWLSARSRRGGEAMLPVSGIALLIVGGAIPGAIVGKLIGSHVGQVRECLRSE